MSTYFSPRLNLVVIGCLLLSLIGIALSSISLEHFAMVQLVDHSAESFCNINATFNCDAANLSRWSRVLGIPLASYGLAFYTSIFFLLLLAAADRLINRVKIIDVIFVLSVTACLVSIILFYISKVEVRSYCLVCIAMYLVNFALLVLSWFARSDASVHQRLRSGCLDLVHFVLTALGLENDVAVRSLAQAGLVSMLALGLLAYSLPEMLVVNVDQSQSDSAEHEPGSLQDWLAQPVMQISLDLSGSIMGDYAKGPLEAPIKVVEFADFECPACQKFFFDMEEILPLYSDQVQFVFKNYPLDMECNRFLTQPLHRNACFAATLVRCAGEQGKFWEMQRYLFRTGVHNSEQGATDPDDIRVTMERSYATLNLDPLAMRDCVQTQRYEEIIRKSVEQGTKLGVKGTPAIWVNGRQVRWPTAEKLQAIFEYVLAHPK